MEITQDDIVNAIEDLKLNQKAYKRMFLSSVTEDDRNYWEQLYALAGKRITELHSELLLNVMG